MISNGTLALVKEKILNRAIREEETSRILLHNLDHKGSVLFQRSSLDLFNGAIAFEGWNCYSAEEKVRCLDKYRHTLPLDLRSAFEYDAGLRTLERTLG